MKKYFLLILLCFFGNICLAQNFTKTFAAQEYLSCGDDLFLNRDSYISLGSRYRPAGVSGLIVNPLFLKISKEGKVVKANIFSPEIQITEIGNTARTGMDYLITYKLGDDDRLIIKIDSNGQYVKGIKFSNVNVDGILTTNEKHFKNKIVFTGSTKTGSIQNTKYFIGIMDHNLNVIKVKINSDSLLDGGFITKLVATDTSIHAIMYQSPNVLGTAGRNVFLELDSNLNIKKAKTTAFSSDFRNTFRYADYMLLGGKNLVYSFHQEPVNGDYANFLTIDRSLDSIQLRFLELFKNPLLDTGAINGAGEFFFSDVDLGGNILYRAVRDDDRFYGSFNLETGVRKAYRSRPKNRAEYFRVPWFNYLRIDPALYNASINSNSQPKIYAQNLGGFALLKGISMDDTSRSQDGSICFGRKDSLIIRLGPKYSLQNIPLVFRDTMISAGNFVMTSESVRICEMDYCNPLRFRGLGADIETCSDSVWLKGEVVYPDQKLEWSTGDTTLRVKVKTGQSYTIKISGYCGVFMDTINTIKLQQPNLVLVPELDTLNTCQPVVLQSGSSQFINPRWFTPKGIIQGSNKIQADTTGYYIIENDPNQCPKRDSIFVDFKIPAVPVLPFSDTLKSCSPIDLFSSISGNISWETPLGTQSQDTINATLTGKYVIRNQFLNCQARDSVFLIFRIPETVSLLPSEDTINTCRYIGLTAITNKFLQLKWTSPIGNFTNVNSLLATATGKYKVSNDTGNCANSDSVFIQFRDTSSIVFTLRNGETPLTNLDITLEELQFPFQLNGITQERAVIFKWYLNGKLQADNSSKQNFTLEDSGTYVIQLITIFADSCVGQAEKILKMKKKTIPEISIPTLVTLNKDGKNDLFEILQLPFYPNNEISIYNRWGKEVHKAKPYQNDWPPVDLEPGTYFYRLKASNKNYNGWVQVVR